jgi:23S rRNA maturation mini-RNase III
VVVVTGDSVLDFKRQITALLLKVKLTRQTITSTVSEIKRLRVGDICLSLKTLADNIFEDIRTILESQRRHVLSSMLRRGVNEIGSAEMKVFLDTDLVPYLTAKERRVTTRARVKEAGEDPVKTL